MDIRLRLQYLKQQFITEDNVEVDLNGITLNYDISGTEGKPWITFSHALCNNLSLWDEGPVHGRIGYINGSL